MMENRERLEQLLEHYSYEELANEERVWVNTFSSQEEYEALQLLNKHLNFSYKEKMKPRPETWQKIKTYQKSIVRDSEFLNGLSGRFHCMRTRPC